MTLSSSVLVVSTLAFLFEMIRGSNWEEGGRWNRTLLAERMSAISLHQIFLGSLRGAYEHFYHLIETVRATFSSVMGATDPAFLLRQISDFGEACLGLALLMTIKILKL